MRFAEDKKTVNAIRCTDGFSFLNKLILSFYSEWSKFLNYNSY